MNNIISSIEKMYGKDVPNFTTGDTVKVHVKIKEGNKERIQVFEGYVLKKHNGGIGSTFTVRRIASGVGVERIFPLFSPKIEKIEVIRKGRVRRAKLFYMRGRTGKATKIKALENPNPKKETTAKTKNDAEKPRKMKASVEKIEPTDTVETDTKKETESKE